MKKKVLCALVLEFLLFSLCADRLQTIHACEGLGLWSRMIEFLEFVLDDYFLLRTPFK